MKSRRAAERRGRFAETLATLFLLAKGYRIIAQRARTPYGEVDIAAMRGRTLVVIEVKARPDIESGIYAVGPRGRGRILRAAQHLAKSWRLGNAPIRFDIVVMRPWAPPLHVVNAWREDDVAPML